MDDTADTSDTLSEVAATAASSPEPEVAATTVSSSELVMAAAAVSSPEREQPPVAPSQHMQLEELFPADASSAEKIELLVRSETIFSGRYSPAEVRCFLASLGECDLRALRGKLHGALTSGIPATAGRPLRNRQAGNVTALADDCWELGYSAAQRLLTRRVDSAVLKPGGRPPLPPPGSAAEPPPGLVNAATVEASLRSVIDSQLRMDRELEDLRRRAAAADAQRVQVQRLEEQLYDLQRACADRDARIDQLEDLLRDMLDHQSSNRSETYNHLVTNTHVKRANPPAAQVSQASPPAAQMSHASPPAAQVSSQASPSAAQVTQASPPAALATQASPLTAQVSPPTAQVSLPDAQVSQASPPAAQDIAAAIDLVALGKAIADRIHWRAGDSDSENDDELGGDERFARRDFGVLPATVTRRAQYPPAHLPHPPTVTHGSTASRQLNAPRSDNQRPAELAAVTGAGAASDLVLSPGVTQQPAKKKFIVWGFRPDASDSSVRGLLQSVAGDVYSFRRLPADGPSAPGAAFMFETAESRSDAVMNSARWPTGLSVRPKADNNGRRRRRFRVPATPVQASHYTAATHQSSHPGPHQPTEQPAANRTQWDAAPTTGYSHEHGEWTYARGHARTRHRNVGSAPASWDSRDDNSWPRLGGTVPQPRRR